MICSKCRVEKKLIHAVLDEEIRQVAATNLLIDYLERDNLLYERRQYKRFLILIKHHLPQLLFRKNCINKKSGTEVQKALSKRTRRMVRRSAKRYFAAILLQ